VVRAVTKAENDDNEAMSAAGFARLLKPRVSSASVTTHSEVTFTRGDALRILWNSLHEN
jgi:hypothetical protein